MGKRPAELRASCLFFALSEYGLPLSPFRSSEFVLDSHEPKVSDLLLARLFIYVNILILFSIFALLILLSQTHWVGGYRQYYYGRNIKAATLLMELKQHLTP